MIEEKSLALKLQLAFTAGDAQNTLRNPQFSMYGRKAIGCYGMIGRTGYLPRKNALPRNAAAATNITAVAAQPSTRK